jgi:hypothetical protein
MKSRSGRVTQDRVAERQTIGQETRWIRKTSITSGGSSASSQIQINGGEALAPAKTQTACSSATSVFSLRLPINRKCLLVEIRSTPCLVVRVAVTSFIASVNSDSSLRSKVSSTCGRQGALHTCFVNWLTPELRLSVDDNPSAWTR